MIKVTKYPAQYSFVGNPVIINIETDSPERVVVEISARGETIPLADYPHVTEVGYEVSIDIKDVLSSFFDKDSSLYGDTIIVAELEDFLLEYTLKIGSESKTLYAIDGGVSNHASATLQEYGEDMFSYRLMNPDRSILFSTRTNSPYLKLKETELFPFVFIHPGKSISFVTASENVITTPALDKGVACLMDINSLRKMFYELYNEIPSYIEIQIEGSSSTYLTLIPSILTEDKYLIRFKNSLGGYEQLEITGKGDFIPEFSEANIYQQYNDNHIFTQKRSRVEMQEIVKIQTGYKTQDELDFLLDMIASERSYFIYPDGSMFGCMISCESPKIPLRVTTPQSLELKITMITKSNYYSPRIDLARPGAWILETGFWNDFAAWKDNKDWID